MMHTRRSFIHTTATCLVGVAIGPISACSSGSSSSTGSDALLPADDNGLMLPAGFSSRVIASSGEEPYAGSGYIWHDAPDGGATFSTDDGGWIYVSNSEVANMLGGAGAIRFDSLSNIVSAYSILDDTSRNCAGGATPWGTWLSCEEAEKGIVWECDPFGMASAIPLPALGVFPHEAAAVDLQSNHLYLTEDTPDGGLYRFIPDSQNSEGRPGLTSGTLQVAVVDSNTSVVNWVPVPDPTAASEPTRFQVSEMTRFNGGEGIVYHNGVVSFATKGDNRIWSYNVQSASLSVLYDAQTHPNPILTGVDNITLTPDGELVVGEDGGDLQLVKISKDNDLRPLVQLAGHDTSEVTGPAFSPDGTRLYFSSQRGTAGTSGDGITFEVSGFQDHS